MEGVEGRKPGSGELEVEGDGTCKSHSDICT